MAPYASIPSASAASGRHSGMGTRPGSTIVSPAKQVASPPGYAGGRDAAALGQSLGAGDHRRAGVGAVPQHQVAAGRGGVHRPLDDRARQVQVGLIAQHTHEHHGDRLVEVQRLRRLGENPLRVVVSAGTYVVTPSEVVLVSRARACTRTIGSLST